MKALSWSSVLLCSLMLFQPLPAFGDNTTSGTSSPIMIGGTPVETFFSATRFNSWYVTEVVAGRSYCVETQSGVHFNAASDLFDNLFDTIVSVFKSDGTTLLVVNDDAGTEPFGDFASRACFIAPVGETIFINVTPFNAGTDSFNARLRIVDTTLFCNWWFIGGDYNAFLLVQNTIINAVNMTITWRDAGGAQRGQTSPAIAGNGTVLPNARSFVTGAIFGSIQIAHNGSPGALVGTTNTQSGSTGLSFDGVCAARPTW